MVPERSTDIVVVDIVVTVVSAFSTDVAVANVVVAVVQIIASANVDVMLL